MIGYLCYNLFIYFIDFSSNSITMAIHVTDKADFQAKLTEAGGKLVIVDFFAEWCGPCKNIAPKLEEYANENASSVVVLKVKKSKNLN